MAKILLTGAAGFIGSQVARMLLDRGDEVVAVDNLNDAYDVRMKEYRLRQLTDRPGFSFCKLDISNKEQLGELQKDLPGTSAVINLAARAGVRSSLENPWVYYDTNVTGTLNLLELCKQHKIGKFILASSSSVYGEDAPMPTAEDVDTNRPLQPYAASKKAAEVLCYSYHYLFNLDVTVFRYFTVYGPASRPDMASFRFTQWISEGRKLKLNGNGDQSRGFTYVDDIANGTLLGLKPLGYEIINLGGHELTTISEMIAMFEDSIGRKADIEQLPRHPADMNSNYADVTKARKLLGWEPKVGIREGIQNLVDWYMSNREWASQIKTS